MAGFVPHDPEVVRSAVQAHSILLQSPRSPAARALDRLAETLWVILLSSSSWLDQRGAASEDFAPAAGYGPLAA
jgi:MinD-like ATPase involved in chromosome partitioning or flagellar assembly